MANHNDAPLVKGGQDTPDAEAAGNGNAAVILMALVVLAVVAFLVTRAV